MDPATMVGRGKAEEVGREVARLDADTIVFLFREEVYERDKEEVKGIAEIIVGKQRNGPIGTVNAAFIHEFTRFENLARDYVPHGSD